MIIDLPLKHYLKHLKPLSNEPLSIKKLMSPFGLLLDDLKDHEFLLVGHVLDDLADQKSENDMIDPVEVASSAWELGYEPAKTFLENGSILIYSLIKSEYRQA